MYVSWGCRLWHCTLDRLGELPGPIADFCSSGLLVLAPVNLEGSYALNSAAKQPHGVFLPARSTQRDIMGCSTSVWTIFLQNSGSLKQFRFESV